MIVIIIIYGHLVQKNTESPENPTAVTTGIIIFLAHSASQRGVQRNYCSKK